MSHGLNLKVWDPIWRMHKPKEVNKIEFESLNKTIMLTGIPFDHAETILNGKGEKCLRIKVFKGVESSILVYDYHFFGPLVLECNKLCYKTLVKNKRMPADQYLPKEVYVLLDEKELAAHIRATLNMGEEPLRLLG